jgi:uncharacterized repeat protein (TIGR04138 family)
MSLRDDLAGVLARDARYHINAYIFIFEAIDFTKTRKRRRQRDRRAARTKGPIAHHVTGAELCEGARDLLLQQYGLLALTVLHQWGLRSTSDFGELVYNLIAAGDLEKAPTDSRADFDDVYDFEAAFRREFTLVLDDVA